MGYSKKISSVLFSASMVFQCLFSLGNADELATEITTQVVYTTPWEALDNGTFLSVEQLGDWYEKAENEGWDENCTAEEIEKTMQWLIFFRRFAAKIEGEEYVEEDIEEMLVCEGEGDGDCEPLNYERIRNLEDIPGYLKVFLRPDVTW